MAVVTTTSASRSSAPASAWTQVLLLSVVCFCCPGLFNALTSFASGLQDPTMAFRGNVIIYLCVAVSSVVAGAWVEPLGIPHTLTIGTLGYTLYALSLWNVQTQASATVASLPPIAVYYASCAALGISAGFLWTAQGLMLMSYATARTRGKFLSVFWVIFNLGATSGGLLTFLLNLKTVGVNDGSDGGRVSNATFLVFTLLNALGMGIACVGIVPATHVVKEDDCFVQQRHRDEDHDAFVHARGGDVTNSSNSTTLSCLSSRWMAKRWSQVIVMSRYILTSWDLLLLLPLFAYSNWFYTYHAFFNVSVFNTRTSGLASALYWGAQMVAADVLGRILDRSCDASHAERVLGVIAVIWNVTWTCGWYVQSVSLQLTYANPQGLDIVGNFEEMLSPMLLYVLYGAGDALGQVWIYWHLASVKPRGTRSRSATQLAGYHAGVYKAVQALSAALAWYLGAIQVPPGMQLMISWVLCNVAVAGAALSFNPWAGAADKRAQRQPLVDVDCQSSPSPSKVLTSKSSSSSPSYASFTTVSGRLDRPRPIN